VPSSFIALHLDVVALELCICSIYFLHWQKAVAFSRPHSPGLQTYQVSMYITILICSHEYGGTELEFSAVALVVLNVLNSRRL